MSPVDVVFYVDVTCGSLFQVDVTSDGCISGYCHIWWLYF